MAEIDISKRKPRRTAGTPSYYYRNRFATAIIIGGCTLFGLLFFIPSLSKANKKYLEYCKESNTEVKEHRELLGFLEPKRGEDILKILKESDDLDKER